MLMKIEERMKMMRLDVSHIYFGAASCLICVYSIVPLLVSKGSPASPFHEHYQ